MFISRQGHQCSGLLARGKCGLPRRLPTNKDVFCAISCLLRCPRARAIRYTHTHISFVQSITKGHWENASNEARGKRRPYTFKVNSTFSSIMVYNLIFYQPFCAVASRHVWSNHFSNTTDLHCFSTYFYT